MAPGWINHRLRGGGIRHDAMPAPARYHTQAMETVEPNEERVRSSMRQRMGVAVLVFLAIIVTCVVTIPWAYSHVQYATERTRSIDVLAAATTRDDLESAVTRLGLLLDLPSGEWIAIRYRDSHAYPGYSIAIALTSDGRWFESDYHYCGLFMTYRNYVERLREAAEIDGPELAQEFEEALSRDGDLKRLRRIEVEYTLSEAVDELRAMNFRDLVR